MIFYLGLYKYHYNIYIKVKFSLNLEGMKLNFFLKLWIEMELK